jgi:hypothetical protein
MRDRIRRVDAIARTGVGPWIEALFRDDSGNWFSLTQPKWLG